MVLSQSLFEIRDNYRFSEIKIAMISFKGAHYPKDVILYAIAKNHHFASAPFP